MQSGAQRGIILVADDDVFFRKLIKSCLSDRAEIIEAKAGQDVLPTYQKYRPDIVFLDIHMPDRDGIDLLGDIMEADPQAFVVMISADSVPTNVLSTRTGGAKGFICKPFTRETIMRYVEACPALKARANKQSV